MAHNFPVLVMHLPHLSNKESFQENQAVLLYMVLICIQNCLSLKLANSLNPEFTLTLQRCYIIAMYNCCIVLVLVLKIGKHHLTFSKRLGHQFISLKKFI